MDASRYKSAAASINVMPVKWQAARCFRLNSATALALPAAKANARTAVQTQRDSLEITRQHFPTALLDT